MNEKDVCSLLIKYTMSSFFDFFGVKVHEEIPHLQPIDKPMPEWEICAIIDLIGSEGKILGYISLNLNRQVARFLSKKAIGASNDLLDDETVCSIFSELANVISGNSQGGIESLGVARITIPKVITGEKIRVYNPSKVSKVIIIPFTVVDGSDIERFDLSIALNSMYFHKE